VGAGTGTIGTSSRVTGTSGWTVGVRVQANHGGDLLIRGVPVGRGLGRIGVTRGADKGGNGSIIIVVATDAPLGDRNLRCLATRAMMGLGRTVSWAGNGSGD